MLLVENFKMYLISRGVWYSAAQISATIVEKTVKQWAEECNLEGSFDELCQKPEIVAKMTAALGKESSKYIINLFGSF